MRGDGQKLLPAKLNKGDVIGFYSPSSPATVFAEKRFERSKQYLMSQGFNLKAGSLTGKSDGYRSGSIQERADELNQLIRDPDVRCIMSTIGGMNSNSLLPYIDYDALRRDPKIIVGYSDVTAILLAIYAQTGLVTFYGPALVASLGEFPPLVDETFTAFREVVTAAQPNRHTLVTPEFWTDEFIDWSEQTQAKNVYPNACTYHGQGCVKGRVIGGNLSTISGFWGSQYMPDIQKGDILFIEDSLKDIETIERLYSLLKVNGVFDKVSAILLGKHELFEDKGTRRTPFDVLIEILKGQHLPVVNGFDCSHTHPMVTLPIGIEIEIDFDRHAVTLMEPWLSV